MATVRAKEAFSYQDVNGIPVMVSPGTLYDSNDPDVKKRAHLFEEVEVAAARRKNRNAGVEDATAEPGVPRSVTKPRLPRKSAEAPQQAPADPPRAD